MPPHHARYLTLHEKVAEYLLLRSSVRFSVGPPFFFFGTAISLRSAFFCFLTNRRTANGNFFHFAFSRSLGTTFAQFPRNYLPPGGLNGFSLHFSRKKWIPLGIFTKISLPSGTTFGRCKCENTTTNDWLQRSRNYSNKDG